MLDQHSSQVQLTILLIKHYLSLWIKPKKLMWSAQVAKLVFFHFTCLGHTGVVKWMDAHSHWLLWIRCQREKGGSHSIKSNNIIVLARPTHGLFGQYICCNKPRIEPHTTNWWLASSGETAVACPPQGFNPRTRNCFSNPACAHCRNQDLKVVMGWS